MLRSQLGLSGTETELSDALRSGEALWVVGPSLLPGRAPRLRARAQPDLHRLADGRRPAARAPHEGQRAGRPRGACGACRGGARLAVGLSGALAGALFGSGWAPLPVAALLARPRSASPLTSPTPAPPGRRGMRAELPGAAASTRPRHCCSAGSALSLRRPSRHAGMEVPLLGPGAGGPPAARWARGRDLASLRVGSPQPAA